MAQGLNQTLIKTSTGVWSVTYNAENRPVRWERGNTIVTMDFDRMGRRVFYKEEVAGEVVTHHKFVYDNYLCVQKLDALNNNSQMNLFVWDPTEPIATRPLFMLSNPGSYKFFYTFDGNKNVSELVHFESRNGIAAHYDYAPFGTVTRAVNTSAISARNFTAENPFRFSSEYHDDTLGLVYYNYRHYNPIDGRWCGRDPIEDVNNLNLYLLCRNLFPQYDYLGLAILEIPDGLPKKAIVPWPEEEISKYSFDGEYSYREYTTLSDGECCVSDLVGTYGFIMKLKNVQDPNPLGFGTHRMPRRLMLGTIRVVHIIRYCIPPKIRCEETIPVDEKKGVWLEDVIENLRPVVTRL